MESFNINYFFCIRSFKDKQKVFVKVNFVFVVTFLAHFQLSVICT
jgi:hypothetical protein